MTDTIAIGDRRELFVDRHLIEKLQNTRLRLHEPRPAGTALVFDREYEGVHCGYTTIVKDGDVYRMYYRGGITEKKGEIGIKDGVGGHEFTCTVESTDGVHWTKPNLGLYEVLGSRDNNVVYAYDDPFCTNFAPFLDTNPAARPAERFKAIAGMGSNMGCFRKGYLPMEKSGIHGFVSPDGLHWKRIGNQRIFDDGTRVFDSDNLAFWSPSESCYVMYYRQHVDMRTGKISTQIQHTLDQAKTIARTTSPDFLHWSPRQELDFGKYPATNLECFYTNNLHPYFRAPHIYIGLAMRFMQGRSALTDQQIKPIVDELEAHGYQGWNWIGTGNSWLNVDCSDGIMLTSRGGNRIDRTFPEAFVRPGPDLRNWTSRCNLPAVGFIQTGPHELSLFVHRHGSQIGSYLERMSLRLDGFASVNAPYDGGEMITKPFTFSGRELALNCATSAAGGIRAEMQGEDGRAIPGFALDDCHEIIGDEIERVVAWKGGSDASKLAGQSIRLRFQMKDADLFSLRFRP